MDYEKKYKDALEKAKEVYNRKDATDGGKLILESMFPELKESEDEKMREMAIKAVYAPEAQSCIKSWGINPDDVIAWLEKQSEQKETNLVEILKHYPIETELYSPLYGKLWLAEVDEKREIITCYKHRLDEGCTRAILKQEDTVSFYSNGTTGLPDFSISKDCMLFLYDIEKQGEQKPAAEVKPKFKAGDWIIRSAEGFKHNTYLVTEVKDYYGCEDLNGRRVTFTFNDVHKNFKLWDISDAKDGDVLVDNYAIIIFRKIGNYVLDDVVDFYICYSFEKGIIIQRHNLHCGFIDSIFFKPATKEQRDMFFQKMHEAGYEWDFKVKELNKIEKKPADKAQPKFKVGDWITNSIEKVQIIGYDIDYGYQVDYKGNLQHRDTDIIEKEYHLWSIQDAKDGDVLYTTCGGKNKMIFIYNGIDVDSVCCYCLYSITGIKYEMFNTVCHIKSDICPATKEQRDTLMKAIADAGYEWDFEVKEFNKIEKKSVCSEEEKQLLLKDLCARLPYKVRCKCVSGLGGGETERGVLKYVGNCYGVISNYYEGVPLHSGFVNNVFYPIENIKPYLRPMSSMTEEEFQKLRSICPHSIINKTNVTEWFVGINGSDYGRISRVDEISEFIDWLNAHYFDFRGLIEKGLALEAPEGMYNGFQKHDL